MKSKILPLLLLLCMQTFAQDTSFQLKDYKYRTPGFKALTLDLNLSGSTTRTDIVNESENTSFQLAPSQLNFTKIISTDKRLHQSSFTLLPRVNFLKTKQNNEETRQNQLQASFQWERSDRFYKSNLHFIEFGNLLNASVADASWERKIPYYKSSSLQLQLQNTFSIGFGHGRIERVQDAQMALFILNDLKAQGLLHGEVTAAQVNSFAQLITEINNRRVFDFRRRRIYELTRIDSFLQNSGLVQKTDIRHFTTVNDNWAFAVNPYRQSGTAWFIRIKPGVGYSRSSSNEKFTTGSVSKGGHDELSFSLTPEAGIEKYIPTSLKWQQNMGITLAYNVSNYDRTFKNTSSSNTTMDEWEIDSWQARFRGFYGVGLFPNNRTRIGLDLLTNFYYGVTHLNSFKERGWTLSPEVNFYANYFIGYRTYLNATAYFRYDYSRYEPIVNKYRNLNASINLGFSHILF